MASIIVEDAQPNEAALQMIRLEVPVVTHVHTTSVS